RFSAEVSVRKNVVCALPQAKLAMVNRAVLTMCDALDGIADEILADPRQCRFDPSTLLCRGGDADDCLTACQVAAMKMAYAPLTTSNGVTIFPGLVPGGESRWLM